MKIELEISENNESTSYPWWLIIDPKQMMKPEADAIAMSMITGPFFSREEAESVLKGGSHHYSKRAVVWCSSGYSTIEYRNKIDEAKLKKRKSSCDRVVA